MHFPSLLSRSSAKTPLRCLLPGLLSLALSSAAHATPYAYASIDFYGFSLSGLDAPGVTLSGSTVTTSSGANYPGTAADGAAAGGNLLIGSDVRQSVSGDIASMPGENYFDQALRNAYGTRADSLITGNLVSGFPPGAASVVAEGRLSGDGTTAGSAGGTSTGFTINLVLTSPTTFTISFIASSIVGAMTDGPLDGASAQVNASFTVTGDNGYFDIFAPPELNASTSSAGGNGDGLFASGPSAYFQQLELAAGTYQFSLLAGAQQRLDLTGSAAVPEPAPLALVGLGLFGMLALRRRA